MFSSTSLFISRRNKTTQLLMNACKRDPCPCTWFGESFLSGPLILSAWKQPLYISPSPPRPLVSRFIPHVNTLVFQLCKFPPSPPIPYNPLLFLQLSLTGCFQPFYIYMGDIGIKVPFGNVGRWISYGTLPSFTPVTLFWSMGFLLPCGMNIHAALYIFQNQQYEHWNTRY